MSTQSPQNAAVWFEIPVSDLSKSMAFYETVTGHALTIMEMGPNKTAIFASDGGTSGHIYEGTPASDCGPTLHLAVVGSLEDAMARTKSAGGALVSDPIAIPAGRFAYATDLDGNSIGLFEA